MGLLFFRSSTSLTSEAAAFKSSSVTLCPVGLLLSATAEMSVDRGDNTISKPVLLESTAPVYALYRTFALGKPVAVSTPPMETIGNPALGSIVRLKRPLVSV